MSQEELYTRNMTQLPKFLKISKNQYTAEIKYFASVLKDLKNRNLIEEDDDYIRLTDVGKLWTDNIIAEFISKRQISRSWKIMY